MGGFSNILTSVKAMKPSVKRRILTAMNFTPLGAATQKTLNLSGSQAADFSRFEAKIFSSGFGATPDVEFFVNVHQVRAHRAVADEETSSNFFIRATFSQKSKNF